jgi:hypothetical protein
MPNERKKGKEFVGGYVPRVFKQELKRRADAETGGDLLKLLMNFIEEGLEKRGIHLNNDGETKKPGENKRPPRS